MLGDPAKAAGKASTPVDQHQHQHQDQGGLNGAGGVGEGGGKYSLLLPHLLDLVAYQSGVDAVEVGATRGSSRACRKTGAAANGCLEEGEEEEAFLPRVLFRLSFFLCCISVVGVVVYWFATAVVCCYTCLLYTSPSPRD